jgi:hypothetical protein
MNARKIFLGIATLGALWTGSAFAEKTVKENSNEVKDEYLFEGAESPAYILWKDYKKYSREKEQEALAMAKKAAAGKWKSGIYSGLCACNGLPGPDNSITGKEIYYITAGGAFDFIETSARNLSVPCYNYINGIEQEPEVDINNFFKLKNKMKIILQLLWWGKCADEWETRGAARRFPFDVCWLDIAEDMGDLTFEEMESTYQKKNMTSLWALLLKTAKRFDNDSHPLYAVHVSEEEPNLGLHLCSKHSQKWMLEKSENKIKVTNACIKVHNLIYDHIYYRYNRGKSKDEILKVASGLWIPERKWGCRIANYKGLKYDFIIEDWYVPSGPVELDGLIESFQKSVKAGNWNMERDIFIMWGSSPWLGGKHEVHTRAWIATNFYRLRNAGFKNIMFFAPHIDDYGYTPLTSIYEWASLRQK